MSGVSANTVGAGEGDVELEATVDQLRVSAVLQAGNVLLLCCALT